MTAPSFSLRRLSPDEDDLVALVALRMKATLVEVLGEARGGTMYDDPWLRDRVRFHLDPARSLGAVFVAERDGAVLGHTIVRRDEDEAGAPIGLFSTIHVVQGARRDGVASALVRAGEAFLLGHGLTTLFTYTGAKNTPLVRLFERHGYAVLDVRGEMQRLRKVVPADG